LAYLFFPLIALTLLLFAWPDLADAKRMGGGGSFGSKPSYGSGYNKPVSPSKDSSTMAKQAAPTTSSRFGGLGGMFGGLLMGGALFLGAWLQQFGLCYTTAGKAGFITGLYVVLVPMIGLFFQQRTNPGTWIGAAAATVGLYLLSVTQDFRLEPGDLLELIGAIFWAGHVLALSWLSPRTVPVRLAMVQFFVCGALSLLTAVFLETITLQAIRDAAVPIFYGGVMSAGVAFTLQIIGQKYAEPSHVRFSIARRPGSIWRSLPRLCR